MRVVVAAAPAPVVSYEEAVARLRLSGGEDERLDVQGMIAAATRTIDGADGWLGRAIGVQTLEAYLPAPTFDRIICLPCPPVIDVEAIHARTESGWSLIDASVYEQRGAEIWRRQSAGMSWPTWIDDPEAVRVRYQAGYDAADPVARQALEGIKSAILLMVGDLYRRRDTVADGIVTKVPMSLNVEALLPSRIYS